MTKSQNELTGEQIIRQNAESLIIFNQALDLLFDFENYQSIIEHLDTLFMAHYMSSNTASETTEERERRVVIQTNLKHALFRLNHQYHLNQTFSTPRA